MDGASLRHAPRLCSPRKPCVTTLSTACLQATNKTLSDSNSFLEAELARRDAEAEQLRAQLQQNGTGGSCGAGSEKVEQISLKQRLERDFKAKVGCVLCP